MKKRYYMDLAEVGARLKAAREALALTMDQMRDITGYSKSLISAAENGLKKPAAVYLYALMDKFNIDVNYIFSGRGRLFLPSPGEEQEQQPRRDQAAEVAGSLIEADENVRELLYLMENVDMVRHAMLGFFIQYRTRNKQVIEELLREKSQTGGEPAPKE